MEEENEGFEETTQEEEKSVENVEKPGKPLRIRKLNLRQEKFCRLYASDKEFFGNGVESYCEAYNVDTNKPNWNAVARQSASKLLTNSNILVRINELIETTAFNDEHADKQLSFLITQHGDLGSKLGAIKEYNKLKQRIIDKTDITSKGKAIATVVKIVKYDDI